MSLHPTTKDAWQQMYYEKKKAVNRGMLPTGRMVLEASIGAYGQMLEELGSSTYYENDRTRLRSERAKLISEWIEKFSP